MFGTERGAGDCGISWSRPRTIWSNYTTGNPTRNTTGHSPCGGAEQTEWVFAIRLHGAAGLNRSLFVRAAGSLGYPRLFRLFGIGRLIQASSHSRLIRDSL